MTTAAQTRGGGPWHLLETVLDGRPVRVTDRPGGVSVVGLDGVSIPFVGGLDAEPVPRALGEMPEIAIRVWDIPIAEMIGRGVDVVGAPATVWRWYEGTTLAQASVVCIGELRGVSYGGETEPLSATVTAPGLGAGIVPRSEAVVSSLTWPVRPGYSVDPEAVGAVYPVVVGRPGLVDGATDRGSSPAFLVELANAPADLPNSRLLIADGLVSASTVTLYDVSGKTSAVRTVYQGADLTGAPISYVDFQGLGVTEPQPEAGREYRIAWDQGGGGVIDPATGAEVRGGAALIRWLLRTYAPAFPLDDGRQQAQAPVLDRYLFDLAIVAPVDPVALVTDAIARWLPARLVARAGGYAWEYRPERAPRSSSVAALDASPNGAGNCERRGAVTFIGDDAISSVSVAYGLAGSQQRASQRVTIAGTAAYLTRIGEQRRLGRRLSLSVPHVCDAATAGLIAEDALEARGYTRRVVEVDAPIEFDRLEPGDAVTFSAADLAITDATAYVESVTVTGARVVSIVLVLDDHPATRSRA